jgi:hypothetical protein
MLQSLQLGPDSKNCNALPAGDEPYSAAHTPHGGSSHTGAHVSLAAKPSMSGARPLIAGGLSSMSGLGPGGLLSRRPSYQVGHGDLGSGPSRQSSIMSMVRGLARIWFVGAWYLTAQHAGCNMTAGCQQHTDLLVSMHADSSLCLHRMQGSSRVFRSNRPPASLQQLWAWSCSLTEGRPVSSMAWNTANNNLLAAGYGSRPAAVDASSSAGAATGAGSTAAGGLGVSAFAQGQQASVVGQGPLLNAPRTAAGADSADGAAGPADSAGGCVALWSLKNQFFPVWSFTTKAGVCGMERNTQLLF